MKVLRSRPVWAAAAVIGLIALASCSTLPTAPIEGGAALVKGSTLASPSGGRSSLPSLTGSQIIDGAVGGLIRVGRWRVNVPAGAYVGVGTITISIPDTTVAKVDLNISPSSLNGFAVPVTLRYQCLSSTDAQSFDMLWWDPSSKAWVVIPSSADLSDCTRKASLPHFSTYASGKGGWKPK